MVIGEHELCGEESKTKAKSINKK